MKILNTLLSVVLVSLFTGCGGSTPAPVKKKTPPPAWVNGVLPNNTSTKLYGLGHGKNRESAIKDALSDMVATLGVSIESSFHSSEKFEHSYMATKTTNDIKSEVAKTKVNNYKVIKSYKVSYNEFAVMIETDKVKFVEGLKSTLQTKKDSITRKLQSVSGEDIVTRYNAKKRAAKEANSLLSTILMISELDPSFDKKANLAFITQVEKAFVAESKKLKFYVSGDRKSTQFVLKVKNFLAKKGFTVVSKKQGAVTVRMTTTETRTKGSIPIAVLNLNISIKDGKNSIGGKSLIIKERFRSSAGVYKNAAIHFEQDIKEQGINEVLGLNLDIDTND